MGGHTQIGEFYTLEPALKMLTESMFKYRDTIGLFLCYASLIYEDNLKLWKLEMRFSK